MKKENPSTLLSIFKRKGGEGEYTKIVPYDDLPEELAFSNFGEDENGLILYYRDGANWVYLSDLRIRACHKGKSFSLENQNLKEVKLALREEFSDGIHNKQEFSRLRIYDSRDRTYVLHLEQGEPYSGIYQVLHFLAGRNSI